MLCGDSSRLCVFRSENARRRLSNYSVSPLSCLCRVQSPKAKRWVYLPPPSPCPSLALAAAPRAGPELFLLPCSHDRLFRFHSHTALHRNYFSHPVTHGRLSYSYTPRPARARGLTPSAARRFDVHHLGRGAAARAALGPLRREEVIEGGGVGRLLERVLERLGEHLAREGVVGLE